MTRSVTAWSSSCCLAKFRLSDRDLIAGGAAGVKIFHHPERCVVILRAQLRGLCGCAAAIVSTGNNGRKITRAGFELATPRGLDLLPGDRDFRVLRPGQPNDICDRVAGRAVNDRDRRQRNEREEREAKKRSHEFFLYGVAFFRN